MSGQSSGTGEPFTRVTVEKAKEMVDGGKSVVIDVRGLDEWTSGHVAGAINIQLDEVMSRIEELPQDKDLLFICAAGVRSAMACE